MQGAAPGDVYDIDRVKEGEFQNWVSAKKSDGSIPQTTTASNASGTASSAAKSGYTASPKSSYPTDEERAKVQVYIVRQSNITAAINTLSVGAKSVKPDDVMALAKRYEDHVFGTSTETAAEAVPFNVATAFDDLDDLPV